MQRCVEGWQGESTSIRDAFATRKGIWTDKAHCDARVEELRKRFGPTFSLEEKRARLSAKHSADKVFEAHTKEVAGAITSLLSRRWTATGAALSQVCSCYVAVLEDSQELSSGLRSLTARLQGSVPEAAEVREAQPASPTSVPREEAACAADEASVRRSSSPSSTAPASSLQATASEPGPPADPEPTAPLATTSPAEAPFPEAHCFEQGDVVQVWSTSEDAWLEGVVEAVYKEAGQDGGYLVPAGVVKVSHDVGVKYIRPDQIATTLRKAAS